MFELRGTGSDLATPKRRKALANTRPGPNTGLSLNLDAKLKTTVCLQSKRSPPATIDVQGLADAEAVNPFRLPRNHSGSRCGGLAPAREALFIGRFRVSRSLELALADYGVAWIGCPSWRSGTRPARGGDHRAERTTRHGHKQGSAVDFRNVLPELARRSVHLSRPCGKHIAGYEPAVLIVFQAETPGRSLSRSTRNGLNGHWAQEGTSKLPSGSPAKDKTRTQR